MNTITVERACPFCGKSHVMTFDKSKYEEGMRKYESGAMLQNAFPDFTVNEREFIKTGICDGCWNNM